MAHAHNHDDTHPASSINRAFVVGIILNSIYVVVEAAWGFMSGSLALLSDAGHNLGDVATLLLALFAIKLGEVEPTDRFTYGFRKSSILVSLANAVLLLIAIGIIGYEAVRRLDNPPELQGQTIAIVAAIGIAINTVTAMLFFRDKDKDLNIKGAYLHLAADALVSLGVVLTGIAIIYTGWFWLDSVVSFAIILVIFYGTWGLLKESLTLSLGGVPNGIDLQEVRQAVLGVEGILDMHHVHIWAISTTQNALTAHIVVSKDRADELVEIIKRVKHEIQHLNIEHSTLEVEFDGEHCGVKSCPP